LIRSNFPVDETFLSSVVNEGLLCIAGSKVCEITLVDSTITIRSNYSIKDIFKEVFSSINRSVSIDMVRNDEHFIEDFKKYFNFDIDIRLTFQDLLSKIKENIDNFKFIYDHLDLSLVVRGSTVLFETNKRKVDVGAPQICKADRFTGYTSLETTFTTKQLKQRCLGETALILILGLLSAYVCSRRDGNNRYYYFLTFAPDEVLRLYLERSSDLVHKYLIVKEEVMKILGESYSITPVNEIPITELTLNLKVQKLLSEGNLDKVSFVLFKIAREEQAYKIYEQIPIRIYRKVAFVDIVERYFRSPDEFIKRLSKIFEDKESRLWKALSSLNSKNKFDEANNVLKAMQGLYWFVVLGDLHGYYQFVREIFNCYRIYERPKNDAEQKIRDYYRSILEELGRF